MNETSPTKSVSESDPIPGFERDRQTANAPFPNVKIYDRPERKGLSPTGVWIGTAFVLALVYLLYRALAH